MSKIKVSKPYQFYYVANVRDLQRELSKIMESIPINLRPFKTIVLKFNKVDDNEFKGQLKRVETV